MIIKTERNGPSVGIGLLDCDHREIDDAMKELQIEIAAGWMRSRVGDQLRHLAQFTLVHFALEEGMMEATNYPMINRHRANHRHMIQRLNGMVSLYIQNGSIPGPVFLSQLPTTHEEHVRADDTSFGNWLDRA